MKYYNYLLILLSVSLLCALAFFLTSGNDSADTESHQPFVSFATVSIPLPDEVEFCGKHIPLDRYDLRERYDREINAFTYYHSTTMLYFKRANRFFPIIEPILKKNGIPDDFKYLCVIESNLNLRAVSPAKAVGLWQFTEAAAKRYGLEITKEVDERYHVEKSTEAACGYFKEAFSKYKDWPSVAASYNAGMGRISSQLESQKETTALNLLLVEETSRYVFRIMAIKQIFAAPYKYGFQLKKTDLYAHIPVRYVEVDSDVADFTAFANQHGISYKQLKDFNTWLRDNKLKVAPGKSYKVAIPNKEDLYFNIKKLKVHDKRWIID